jgi:hypothetical protein
MAQRTAGADVAPGVKSVLTNVMSPDLQAVVGSLRTSGWLQRETAHEERQGRTVVHAINMIFGPRTPAERGDLKPD